MPAFPITLHRRTLLATVPLLLAGCALPINHGIGDWARTASLAIDNPAMAAPSDATRATQLVLARYFFALGILADPADLILPDDGAALITRMAGAAQTDPRALNAILQQAVRATPRDPVPPKAPDAPPPPRDDRFHDTVQAADRHVQALLTVLIQSPPAGGAPGCAPGQSAAMTAERTLYRQTLERIGQGHAMLTAQGYHLDEQQSRRAMDSENLQLRRLLSRRTGIAPAPAPCAPAMP